MPRWLMRGVWCLVLLGGLMLCDVVKADLIKCSFAEPFMTTSYDTSLRRMTVTYDVEKRRAIFNVSRCGKQGAEFSNSATPAVKFCSAWNARVAAPTA